MNYREGKLISHWRGVGTRDGLAVPPHEQTLGDLSI
jgi:hypothetical protein